MERPLHVRVAEALGWVPDPRGCYVDSNIETGRDGDPFGWSCSCGAEGPASAHDHTPEPPRYDLYWGQTGPLIERLRLMVEPDGDGWDAMTEMVHRPSPWPEDKPYGGRWTHEHRASGPTPLIAVCNLILALHAAGKLHLASPDVPASVTGERIE